MFGFLPNVKWMRFSLSCLYDLRHPSSQFCISRGYGTDLVEIRDHESQ
jgi:hypothetical protein